MNKTNEAQVTTNVAAMQTKLTQMPIWTKAVQTSAMLAPFRTHNACIFEMVFREKRKLLELYNAINGTDYKDPELLTVNTLGNAIYMNMHNDSSFIVGSRLCLYEHQSTYNPNIPMRFLFYLADMYSVMVKMQRIYQKTMLSLPNPKFVIFYNSTDRREDEERHRLSTLYNRKTGDVSLELIAAMYNLDKGQNEKLLQSCRTLADYAEYVYRIRKYAKEMPIENAVGQAITECIAEGILADFLKNHRSEAKEISIYEYNEEANMQMLREDSYAVGLAEGQKLAAKTLVNNVEFAKSTLLTDAEMACQILRVKPAEYLDAKRILAASTKAEM